MPASASHFFDSYEPTVSGRNRFWHDTPSYNKLTMIPPKDRSSCVIQRPIDLVHKLHAAKAYTTRMFVIICTPWLQLGVLGAVVFARLRLNPFAQPQFWVIFTTVRKISFLLLYLGQFHMSSALLAPLRMTSAHDHA